MIIQPPRFTSYISVALMFILFVAGLIFFSYVFIVVAILGAILYLIAYIRLKFFARKQFQQQKTQGRVIEHDDTPNGG